ncbi:MAG: hypothetical protein EU541_05375 [Promethearchaeota archaeon]|nr:MAG: hypothetical protein EU541_05375 [Candidatus Lokiarchaeota archaeon]
MNDQNSDSEKKFEELAREEVIELYKKALNNDLVKKYEKSTKVLARNANDGEIIITSIDGEERTKNKAKAGDVIVKNPSGEEYIVTKEKFNQRYQLIGDAPEVPEYKEYKALGTVWGFQYEGPNVKIEAPWGEEQIVKNGDMIVSLNKNEYDDIYSIQIDVFKDTYKKNENKD